MATPTEAIIFGGRGDEGALGEGLTLALRCGGACSTAATVASLGGRGPAADGALPDGATSFQVAPVPGSMSASCTANPNYIPLYLHLPSKRIVRGTVESVRSNDRV